MTLIAAMPADLTPAKRLAEILSLPCDEIEVHRFPDGESRVRALKAAPTVIIYCSLNDPNRKLIELGLAAAAFRDLGVKRLVLVAPYLCYMRQDAAFHAGEAVSQRVIGRFLAERFDRIVTVEPHLHRTSSLADMFPRSEATALSAAPVLAELIGKSLDKPVIIGPDEESRRWAKPIATALAAPLLTLDKTRAGDRSVRFSLDADARLTDRNIALVDDVASTGTTLGEAAKLIAAHGALRIEAFVVHALFSTEDLEQMKRAGISAIRSVDTVVHPTNAATIASIVAEALRREC
jgi:ribose-phosphate pyrophosphokinase